MALMGTAGERVSAQRMYDLGIVTELVPYERLMERAREIADIVMQMSPVTTRLLLEGAWRMRDQAIGVSEASRWAHDQQRERGLRESFRCGEGICGVDVIAPVDARGIEGFDDGEHQVPVPGHRNPRDGIGYRNAIEFLLERVHDHPTVCDLVAS